MTAEASKLAAVAVGAAGLDECVLHPVVLVEEIRTVVGGLEGGDVVVALLAGEGRVHFVVANQAVRHEGKDAGGQDIVRQLDTVMATGATVGCVQMSGRPGVEILLAGNGGAHQRHNAAKLDVQLVVEFVHLPFGGSLHAASAGMAGGAGGRDRKIVIRSQLASGHRSMAVGTLQAQSEMLPV